MNPEDFRRKLPGLSRTDAMVAIVEMARMGGSTSPEDAISHVAAMIDRLDKSSPSYDDDVRVLLSIGATIWMLEYESTRGA